MVRGRRLKGHSRVAKQCFLPGSSDKLRRYGHPVAILPYRENDGGNMRNIERRKEAREAAADCRHVVKHRIIIRPKRRGFGQGRGEQTIDATEIGKASGRERVCKYG